MPVSYPFFKWSLVLLLSILCIPLMATHNRAGEITYVQTGDLSITATITTYTKASSIPADRDSLEICWGDGQCEWAIRINGPGNPPQGQLLANNTKLNIYVASHIYPGPGHYTISMTDPNRNSDVCNVNFPNADNVPFHLQTTVTFLNPQFEGTNNSPILLQPPIDIGCVGQPFLHNPNAYDPDGDSLSFHLIKPMQDVNTDVPNYLFPDQIEAGSDNLINLNARTGDFLWMAPQRPCEYNIAMIIVEYRNGIPIDTLIRDMQILIVDCENSPPEIETENEYCVVAGETLTFEVIATDPDINPVQLVELNAFGAPFVLDVSPATFQVTPGFQPHPLFGIFRWETTCEHISDQYYTVIFRAADNFPIILENPDQTIDTSMLSTLKTVRIKVVGPPPEDVQANGAMGQIEVTWAHPYSCEDAADDYFHTFSVWRRESPNPFLPDCTPGLAGQGYTKIDPNAKDIIGGRYFYLDTEVERGRTYCYRILAEFARTSAGGFPFNMVESLASEEICVQLDRDIPLITNVDVLTTDNANGSIEVRWTKPRAEDLDTLQNPGPYRYELLRGSGTTPAGFAPVPGASFISNTFAHANDTVFIDNGLNTLESAYSYQVAFYVNNETDPIGTTPGASSVFLSLAPTDEANVLTWVEEVTWDNYKYDILRFNGISYDSIGSATEPVFTDTGLTNGETYCYIIRSLGTYGISGVSSPLINHSQENCGVPLDNIPPCPPELEVNNICTLATSETPEEAFENNLEWTNPNLSCPQTDDVDHYLIFYAPVEGLPLEVLQTIEDAEKTNFVHQPETGIAGCYAVSAVDSVGNESVLSNVVCIDNCPIYDLPNVFTPNGDGDNDLFIPFPYRFIDHIDLQIYNRWGGLVFETSDPDINWDGRDSSGNEVAEGVYYYTCRYFEQTVSGVVANPEILRGYIELIRGR